MGYFSSLHTFKPYRVASYEKQPTSHSTSTLSEQRRKHRRRRKRQQKKLKQRIAEQKRRDTALIYEMYTAIHHHFPDLFDQMGEIDEVRDQSKATEYELAAHLTAGLALFLFKLGSRNQWNQKRRKLQFQRNYKKLFGFAMPHGDSVNQVISQLDEVQVEWLKQQMIRALLERKTFRSSRYRNRWYRIAIDGSGVVSFDHKHCDQCLHKTSKMGKVTYSHQVLDARLVTPSGFSVSVATVWIENPADDDYDKQDCERNAFQRLAEKLKQAFPHLPILIEADGLYPYEGFFETCRDHGRAFTTTFKEGNLSTVWQEVHALKPLQPGQTRTETRYEPGQYAWTTIRSDYEWVSDLDYQGYTLHWVSCRETITRCKRQPDGSLLDEQEENRFVHITSLPVDHANVVKTSQTARLRWKVENEGFNTLKNGGYGMQHKWARKNYIALKNYYQLMQMAHLIHQLMLKRRTFVETWLQRSNHPTVKALWEDLLGAMQWSKVKLKRLRQILETPIQYRLVT